MLVLARKVGEEVRLGNDVSVRVLGIKQGKVRLGFVGPTSLPIHRGEVYDKIHQQKEEGPST